VFQTGPGHPWLVETYARVATRPHISVIAQEVFQANVIPSDTDFRIYRDFGQIPGFDMALHVTLLLRRALLQTEALLQTRLCPVRGGQPQALL
jgi:hypothetical protein